MDDSKAASVLQAETAPEPEIDLDHERKIVRKVDIRLIPILGALCSVAGIDRTNISFAAIAGMTADLKLGVGSRYSIALLIFFVPYCIFELPSNIILRRVGTAAWLGSITLLWGGVMIGMGFLHDWKVLVVCRTLLGVFESGFFPGCLYLICCWYTRYEVQKRLAGFYLVTVLLGCLSVPLAYGLTKMDGISNLAGWRWIFIIEGVLTCVVALGAYFLIIDFPDKLLSRRDSFLTPADVKLIIARIDRDRDDSEDDPVTWAKVLEHLSDWKMWIYGIMFMNSVIPPYALAYFLPIILRGMGYSVGRAQLLTAPPFVAAAIAACGLAYISDRTRLRAPWIALCCTVVIVGLAITAHAPTNAARYFGVFVACAGAQSNVAAVLAYQANNIRTHSKRSVGSALQVGFGAVGGIVASTVYRRQDAPKYRNGMWATIGTQLMTLVGLAAMTGYFRMMNTRGGVVEGKGGFKYTI